MTDHRGDPGDAIDQVGAATVPPRSARVEPDSDQRVDAVSPGREPRPRIRAGAITGQTPVVRMAVAADLPSSVASPIGGTTVDDPPAQVRIPRVVPAADPDEPIVPVPPPPAVNGNGTGPAYDEAVEPSPQPAARPRPVRIRRSRPRVRRVRRVLRSIDTWTVFKVSAIFWLVAYVIVLVAGVLLWNLANSTGTIDNIERFFESFGWDSFEFKGGEIYHSYWIIGLFLVVAGTGINVTLSVLYNLIAELVGGIGVTVLEEEVRVVRAEELPVAAVEEEEPELPIETLEADLWNDITGGTFRTP